MARALRKSNPLRLVQSSNSRPAPIQLPANYKEDAADATSCDAPRRGWLVGSILKMNAIGFIANAFAAGAAYAILAQSALDLGHTVESYNFLIGRDAEMTGVNSQGIAWTVLTFVTMLVNVGIVFHLIHDTSLHYRFRSWVCRVLASVIASLSIIDGDREKAWSRAMLDRSRMDRVVGCLFLLLAGIPLFVAASIIPWFTVLAWLGFPSGASIITAIGLGIVLVPTCIELVRIAFHIYAADPAE